MPSAVAAWNPARAKIQLRLAIQRVRLLAQKRTQLAKSTRREVAALVEKGKLESAKIKVEGLLSEDLYVELLEVLELYCELLLARFGLLETVKRRPPASSTLHRGATELKELHVLREMLMSKGGRDFAIACIDNLDDIVTSKLKVDTPAPELVELYLYEIARAYAVDWRPEGYPDPNAPPPLEQPAAKDATVVRTNLPPAAASAVAPAAPATTAPPPPPAAPAREEDAFEALQKRFAELKRR
ncbi:uncharacterized protein RHOBADRAFT_13105 [Rhodotorula graminis WP1]|uniref:DUF292-domain-containing protein n=1 Tax=Rhodotorula graminis (strain WP1) TaxID=578459 RepID=A0A194SAJ6_RHOGW|nr:uncharacterized protein RHOBADRAFT_13105 [Rhodotorula graminis WP1]KPV76421.1 hypothetical protein RHOBADRAFT_13105 [Rhodotorula graminis WP1]